MCVWSLSYHFTYGQILSYYQSILFRFFCLVALQAKCDHEVIFTDLQERFKCCFTPTWTWTLLLDNALHSSHILFASSSSSIIKCTVCTTLPPLHTCGWLLDQYKKELSCYSEDDFVWLNVLQKNLLRNRFCACEVEIVDIQLWLHRVCSSNLDNRKNWLVLCRAWTKRCNYCADEKCGFEYSSNYIVILNTKTMFEMNGKLFHKTLLIC